MLALDVDPERLREVCERHGVASLAVFGSVARGEDRGDSDVDLLYFLKPDARLGFRMFDIEDELADLFGRPVDLLSRKSINKTSASWSLPKRSPSMRRELLLLREMRAAAVAIREVVGDRSSD